MCMLIRDLEGKSGLDRATIRFYEREGLITPQRKENGYREYTQDDLQQLLKIKLLRQLGIPLETIKGLQQGPEDFGAALAAQIRVLERKIMETARAKDICTELYQANTSYADLNAEYYLRQLNRPEQHLARTSFREPVKRPHHPVRRFLARMTDYAIARMVVKFLLIVVLRIRPYGSFLSGVVSYGVPFLMVPISAFLVSRWGTTPGKWLFGLAVQSENGGNLRLSSAWDREWQVLREGYGFGIPLWSLWRLYKSYSAYADQETDWDCWTEYQYLPWQNKRKTLLAAACAVIVGMNLWIGLDAFKPKFRGPLTVPEFAENYNFYYTFMDDQITRSERMQPDGTWYLESNEYVTIYVNGQPEETKKSFDFTMNNEQISEIRYENSWSDVFMLTPVTASCKNAAITAIMSQKGMGLEDWYAFAKQIDSANLTEDGRLTYANIEIAWDIETENCKVVNQQYFVSADESLESSVRIVFEIRIHS